MTAAPAPASHTNDLHVTDALMARWFLCPLAFAVECLRFKPDRWQEKVLRLVEISPRRGLRIAMMACKGPGKSALLAVLILWFLFTRPYANIIVTSITGKNLEDGLWKELSKWGEGLKGTFEFDKKRITHRKYPDRWFVSARTWPKDADSQTQADSLAGVHEDYIMFVLDEVSEYPEGVVAAAEGALATGKETILLAAGNCTRTNGSPLYRIATQDLWSRKNTQGWRLVKVTGDPDNPDRSPRVDIEWARNLIRLWGRDHPIVRTNVLAEFPLAGSGALLSPLEIEQAQQRNHPEQTWCYSAKVIGVDVARFGQDKTVYFPRQGLTAFQPHIYAFTDRSFHNQARDLIDMANRFDMDAGFVEVNGLGAGFWDALMQLDRSPRWIAVNVTTTEGVDPRYHNMRAHMQFKCAEWVKTGGALPDGYPELKIEGSAANYDFHKQTGKIIISEKQEICDTIGHSPDLWDALCLTHTYPVCPKVRRDLLLDGMKKKNWDYNPFVKGSPRV